MDIWLAGSGFKTDTLGSILLRVFEIFIFIRFCLKASELILHIHERVQHDGRDHNRGSEGGGNMFPSTTISSASKSTKD